MILVTGSLGQIGIDLIRRLAELHGADSILATDVRNPESPLPDGVTFRILDITDSDAYAHLVSEFRFETIYHLAGILSARGEANPDLCWSVNVDGLKNVLSEARRVPSRIFWPSSIAVFGANTEKSNTPQQAAVDPYTIYGVSKATGELMCRFEQRVFGTDVRSIRFPGVISYASPPGGGTTDFAVDMFFKAVESGTYTCFVNGETRLPMMYMPDAVKSIIDLMNADADRITVRTSYNVTGFSFSAEELAGEIRKHIPGFECSYTPDFRQAIADTWPRSIDDSRAREDWDWTPDFDLPEMVVDMLDHIRSTHLL